MLPSLPLPSVPLTEDELILNARQQLDGFYLDLKELSKMKLTMTIHLNSASPAQREVRQVDLDTVTRLHDEMSAKCKSTQAALNDMVAAHNMRAFPESDSDNESSATSISPAAATSVRITSPTGVLIKIDAKWPTYINKGATSAYDFFDAFVRRVLPVLAKEMVKREAHIYLTQLISDEPIQDLVRKAFERTVTPDTVITEAFLGKIFFETCLTKTQREAAVTELLSIGRKKTETWVRYSQRILQITKRLQVQSDNHLVLHLIKASVPHTQLTTIQLWHNWLQPPKDRSNPSQPETFEEFCRALALVSGPEDVKEEDSTEGTSSSQNKKFCRKCNKDTNHL